MHRMTIEFNDQAYNLLGDLSGMTGKTKVDLLRQGLILRHYFEVQNQEGNSIALVNGGKIKQEIILT